MDMYMYKKTRKIKPQNCSYCVLGSNGPLHSLLQGQLPRPKLLPPQPERIYIARAINYKTIARKILMRIDSVNSAHYLSPSAAAQPKIKLDYEPERGRLLQLVED